MNHMSELIPQSVEPNAWWMAQYERTASADFINKLDHYAQQSVISIPTRPNRNLEKSLAIYGSLLENHANIHSEALSAIYYISAESLFPSRPYKKYEFGASGYGHRPLLYSDATIHSTTYNMPDTPLSNLQKGIIATHEAYHSLVPTDNNPYIKGLFETCLRLDTLHEKDQRNSEWHASPAEIMAQMAEMKNYFSFQSSEEFTKEHLDVAKANYTLDTGFTHDRLYGSYAQSGRLAILFTAIEAGDEDTFIQLMNTLPV